MDARAWPALSHRAGAAGVAGEAFNPMNVQDGLFEGFLVECVMKHVLTSPSSALAGDDFHVSNSCNAVIHRMMMAEAENIAYAAVQARSAITSRDKWTTEDSKFSYRKFYYRIIDVIHNLPDKAWATATLQHYNLKLFTDKAGRAAALSTSATSDVRDLDKDEDDVALMCKQFALRSANLASTVKPAPPPPAPSSIDSEVLPPRLHTHKDPSLSASSSPTPHSSSPAHPASKLDHPVASIAPLAPKPRPKPRQGVATPSEASTPLPRKKQKSAQPESPLTESNAEEVEAPVRRLPQKAQPKASSKTAKSTSALKKRRGRK
ncbi:hypothetical protein DFJ58DRAFT_845501 [Suillus subalutaceus]|uniref:uncharacterized protein n=1 Tax=Suillus subalutaceus TaxID=48586 RepID=UPI001B886AE5|nr:uncharacterized protein DFJ58DRAFT_845501 [Suillus subalutaceus]KAG1839966.1 hypothetical protein DFJ58DRAFT_845501 [Suillus subalutaceus]